MIVVLSLFSISVFACGSKNDKVLSENKKIEIETSKESVEVTTEEIKETIVNNKKDLESKKEEIKEDSSKELVLTSENYPRVDGSTANMPLMAQIRSDILNENILTSQNKTEVTTTDYAWRNLLNGDADLLLVYEASSETKEIIKNSNVELKITPIGVDALVFIVNGDNKVNNLTIEQLQNIYTGDIINWKDVGGDDKNIQAFQRPLNSGSQTLFLNKLMKGKIPKTPLKHEEPADMDGLIDMIASYNNSANAIGYSVFYYAKKMYQVPGLKLISVDGINPDDETIGSGVYPFLNSFYLVIREDTPKNSATQKLYDYILSDKGKEAIIKSGYIPYIEK